MNIGTRKSIFVSFLLFLLAGAPVFGLEFFLGTGVTVQTVLSAPNEAANPLYVNLGAGLAHEVDDFRFAWELDFDTQGKYPQPFMGTYFGNFTVDIAEAGLSYNHGAFGFRLGKLENRDIINSPYALFISGQNHKAMLAEFSYEDEIFFFSDRWVGLNNNLSTGLYSSSDTTIYNDRGMVLKTYGLKFGRFRFGFQDASVFTGEYFDVDFFANPAPGFFIQYVALAGGRPWTEIGNQNSILGFFVDYRTQMWSTYAQILVDDLNMNRFLIGDPDYNPDKIAFSVGGTVQTDVGLFGVYLGGATRYTFESIDRYFYSYTYYPGSAINSNGSLVGIPLSDQMIGFVHGENSMAIMGTWSHDISAWSLGAAVEFAISGEKSPANPWHGGETWGPTHWLNDSLHEKKLSLTSTLRRTFGPFELNVAGTIGWIWNKLELAEPYSPDNKGNMEKVWSPSNKSGLLAQITLSGRYSFKPSKILLKRAP